LKKALYVLASSISQLIHLVIHLAWPVLVAQLAMMANVLMTLISAGEQSGQTTVSKQNASQVRFGILWPRVQQARMRMS